jgi:hypothetical protein
VLWRIVTAPDEAETMGTLKLGADDQGFVAAVAVTVWTEVRAIRPDDAEIIGMLKPGALLHGLVAAVDVIVPDVTATSDVPPDEATMTSGAEDNWIIPDDAETIGTLKLGAEDHGSVATVEAAATAPATIETASPPDVVTVAMPEDVPTKLKKGVVLRLPRIVTPRPPDVVTGATPSDVPTMLTSAPPRIVTPRPPEVVTGATPEDVPTILMYGVPVIWINPLEALTSGMLKPGAHDHGFVAAVAVTVCTDDSEMIPEDALTNGILKLGAEDQGFVAAVAVTVCTDDKEMIPDEALTIGTLKLGADDHGLVAAVAVTVGTLEKVTRPDDKLARRPAEVVTGATAVEAAAPTTRTWRCWDDETWKLSMFWPDVPGAGGTLTKGIT